MQKPISPPEFAKPDSASLRSVFARTASGSVVYVGIALSIYLLFELFGIIDGLIPALIAHAIACLPFCLFLYSADELLCKTDSAEPADDVDPDGARTLHGIYRLRFWARCAISLSAGALGAFILKSLIGVTEVAIFFILGVALLMGNLILTLLSYEIFFYIVFGVLTSVVSIGSFSLINALFVRALGANYLGGYGWLIPQTISFVGAVLFGFLTNRKYVFVSSGNIWRELIKFAGSRMITTLVLEYGGMFVMSNLLSMNEDVAKIIAAFLVVIVNYFISKFMIFNLEERR